VERYRLLGVQQLILELHQMHMLIIVKRHKSVQLLEDLDFAAVSQLVGLLLQYFEKHLIFVLVDVTLDSGTKLVFFEEVAYYGLGTHE